MHRLFVPEPLKMQRYFRRPRLLRNLDDTLTLHGLPQQSRRIYAAQSPQACQLSSRQPDYL
jgi:hypothetical protein